jgi:murein DD-endopeptidase MepM/ murein hydrolase activator NlpD
VRSGLVSRGIPGTFLATEKPGSRQAPVSRMHDGKAYVSRSLDRHVPGIAMLAAAGHLLLGSLAVPLFDDEGVVAFHLAAMAAPTDLATVCAPPARDLGADFPVALVYAGSLSPSTPALWTTENPRVALASVASGMAAVATTEPANAPRRTQLRFAPLSEPAFDRRRDSFVLVRDEGGHEVARGWLAAQRVDVAWQSPAPKRRGNSASPLLDEYLARLRTLRDDPYIVEIERTAREGETLRRLLDDAELERRDLSVWIHALEETSGPVTLVADQRVSLLVDKRDRTLRQLRIDVNDDSMIAALRRGPLVVAERVPIPLVKRLRAVGAEIETSLYAAAAAVGVPESTVAQMAEILGWELDLSRLRRGAKFRAVYEETVRVDTEERTAGQILAVEITDNGRTHEGYYFADNGGMHGTYYTREARPLGGSFLRYPVSFTRISSFFSDSRFHPIKNRHLPHFGVDFAAPTGTPVVAVGAGVIAKAGWNGGNGRMVQIRHDETYESAYAHLSAIATGIKPGARVTQGQVIGYVGASGLATGPHLHYAVYRDGQYVDPLKVVIGRKPELDGIARTAFQLALGTVDDAFERAGLGRDAIVQVSMASNRR